MESLPETLTEEQLWDNRFNPEVINYLVRPDVIEDALQLFRQHRTSPGAVYQNNPEILLLFQQAANLSPEERELAEEQQQPRRSKRVRQTRPPNQ